MNPQQLKETTMSPSARKLINVSISKDDTQVTTDLVDRLMGKKPEMRFQFITDNAKFAEKLDI